MPQVHDGTYTPAEQFVKDPDSLCSTVTWKDEEDRVIWVYRIQVCFMSCMNNTRCGGLRQMVTTAAA